MSARKPERSKDFDVRCAVVRQLLSEGVPRGDIRHEIPMNSWSSGGRVDLAVLRDDRLVGIEIKSGKDKFDRLPAQHQAMRGAFDTVRVVIDTRIAAKALLGFYGGGMHWYRHETGEFVERYRAEWLAAREVRLSAPERWEGRHSTSTGLTALLWKDEVCPVAAAAGGKSRTRTAAMDWIRENMALKDLRPGVIAALRARALNRWEIAFWRDFATRERAVAAA